MVFVAVAARHFRDAETVAVSGRMAVRKGKTAERAFVAYMNANGHPGVERRLSGGECDTGDTTGHPGLVHEVKARKTLALAEWVDQLGDEMDNGGVDLGAVIVKRVGKTDVGQWYAVLPVSAYVKLTRLAGFGDPIEEIE